jgi:hypothetical protein
MPSDPRRNRHHFLARHLLAHFAAPDGLLHVYDRRLGWTERRDLPKNLAVERFLYAPESDYGVSGDPKDDAVERWLADEIDGPAAEPIKALAGGAALTDLSDNDHHAIADFLALLDLRTPAIRDLLVPLFAKAAEDETSDVKRTQKQLRRRGVHVTQGEIRRVNRRKRSEITSGVAKPGWLHYLQDTRQIARINVKARRWSIVQTVPGVEFITSDLGIAKSLLGPFEPASWEPGTLLGRAHWIVPISPERAIAITPAPFPEDPVSSRELVRRTNRQLISDARRYVYSRSPIDRTDFDSAPEIAGKSGNALRSNDR